MNYSNQNYQGLSVTKQQSFSTFSWVFIAFVVVLGILGVGLLLFVMHNTESDSQSVINESNIYTNNSEQNFLSTTKKTSYTTFADTASSTEPIQIQGTSFNYEFSFSQPTMEKYSGRGDSQYLILGDTIKRTSVAGDENARNIFIDSTIYGNIAEFLPTELDNAAFFVTEKGLYKISFFNKPIIEQILDTQQSTIIPGDGYMFTNYAQPIEGDYISIEPSPDYESWISSDGSTIYFNIFIFYYEFYKTPVVVNTISKTITSLGQEDMYYRINDKAALILSFKNLIRLDIVDQDMKLIKRLEYLRSPLADDVAKMFTVRNDLVGVTCLNANEEVVPCIDPEPTNTSCYNWFVRFSNEAGGDVKVFFEDNTDIPNSKIYTITKDLQISSVPYYSQAEADKKEEFRKDFFNDKRNFYSWRDGSSIMGRLYQYINLGHDAENPFSSQCKYPTVW